MAVKPATVLRWCTGNPVDPTSGQDAIIDPAGSKIVSGFLRLEKPPRQDHNYFFNLAGEWNEWLEQETDANKQDLIDHEGAAAGQAHGALQIDNDSIVSGATVEDALNTLDGDIGTNATNIGTNATNISNHISAAAGAHASTAISSASTQGVLPGTTVEAALEALDTAIGAVTGVIQLVGEAGIEWNSPALGDQSSKYSNDFAVVGVKVGDIVLVTLTNRPTIPDAINLCTFEGIVASVGNIKINAVNHDDTLTVSEADLDATVFNITILSFT